MLLWLEKFVFYSLIFALPFQTRKIIAQFGGGAFNEWLGAYVYLTDILLLALVFLWFWRRRKDRFFKNLGWAWLGEKIKSPDSWLIIFLAIALVSLSQAESVQLGVYGWLKLLEFSLFFFYLKSNAGLIFNLRHLAPVVVFSGLVQSIIAIGQYLSQKSLGLWFLGESPLALDIDGVAKITVSGEKIVRAYGGLPHPNLLAIFLLLSVFFLYYLWLGGKHSFRRNIFFIAGYALLFAALCLTFSRLIMAVFLLASFVYFALNFKKQKKKTLGLFSIVAINALIAVAWAWPEFSGRFNISLQEQSVVLRQIYNQFAFLFISEQPFLGVGQGNFVFRLREMLDLMSPWIWQPVHNIYLLMASETGLIGLSVFLLFLFRLFKNAFGQRKTFILLIGFSFLFIGMFDHFFWTLQQGQLAWWLVLGLLSGKLSAD